jgi:ribosomal protein S18 acetylase RimI-like enzyme
MLLLALLPSIPPPANVGVREATRVDWASYRKVSDLIADGFAARDATSTERSILAQALYRNLVEKFTSRNRRRNSLFLATDERSGEVVGVCGIEMLDLSPTAKEPGQQGAAATTIQGRPLLSNLAVGAAFRGRGTAKKLCRCVESTARSWGEDEILLKVESENRRARNLYRSLGYRVVATLRDAEKPQPRPWGIEFVPTKQVAMRKSLRGGLPLDNLDWLDITTAAVCAGAAAAAGAWLVEGHLSLY